MCVCVCCDVKILSSSDVPPHTVPYSNHQIPENTAKHFWIPGSVKVTVIFSVMRLKIRAKMASAHNIITPYNLIQSKRNMINMLQKH